MTTVHVWPEIPSALTSPTRPSTASPSLGRLILAAAQSSGAQILYTEDLNDGQQYGNLRVENPFRDIKARRS